MTKIHKSVMLGEVLEYLNIKPGAKVIDATLNGGGHTEGILEKYPDTKILGIEWDPDIFQEFQSNDISNKITAVNDSYVNLKNIAERFDFRPDGIIFDLGVSSVHYEKSGRGFSFMRAEPLDMRFNPKVNDVTAADIINTTSRDELDKILADYGEEQFSAEIAKRIVDLRKIKPIIETTELVEIIKASVPAWYRTRKIHPATKTFQALRIAVNQELDNVTAGVLAAIDILEPGGRLVVISFHGLEDKIVREIFKNKTKEGVVRWVVKGTIKPEWKEVQENPRARSAKMKIVEKL
ncbi:MAG: 16S rRNA (cytosine(1402)-N(4))-methyltransferase RsmH [bacterium]|nr:16S rRNA (cytosine(1402)-N(4))-methyltransferase RsmH [bacterium]MDO8496388.1 16S rRNA (cytosine(1402)-N(4))-methyltransferase RsmH [bacterium]